MAITLQASPSIQISLLLILALASTTLQCSIGEAEALLKLKSSLGNPYRMRYWRKSVDCCKWTDVTCSDDNGAPTKHVTKLEISYSNSTGTISPSIGDLKHLNILLIVSNKQLKGNIPSSIGNLTNLRYLRIKGNPLLTGSIPRSICKLNKLVDLNLHENQLSGPIPDCLGSASLMLEELFLQHNKLSGTIPKQIGELKQLKAFDVSDNMLCGAIPNGLYLKKLEKPLESFARNKCLCGAPLQPCARHA